MKLKKGSLQGREKPATKVAASNYINKRGNREVHSQVSERIKTNEPLSKHSTFKIGGPARYFVETSTIDELKEALEFAKEKKLEVFFLGKGSNLLFSDKGFNGLVIKPSFSRVEVHGDRLIAEAGASLHKLINIAMNHSLTGLESVCGIPGSVGGAIAMNAGVGKSAIGDKVIRVWGLGTKGLGKTFATKECKFGYRKSIFQKNKYIITKVEFQLEKGNKQKIRETIKQMWAKRLEKQPYNLPSAGSVFKNPKNDFAGRLIEEAGCKGLRMGGAEVSKMHANFIVNTGRAKAKDVKNLIKMVQQSVFKAFKIKLVPEIKIVE
jgi:UDP-N-acetylmuramate dehydrogenase